MDFNTNRPIYLQIADGVMDSVISGEYSPGERIPSVRDYAAKVVVNFNTVMRSYDWLQQHGVIYNRRGIGFFIADDARERIATMRREAFFSEEADHFFSRLRSFGLSPDDLAALYRAYLDKK